MNDELVLKQARVILPSETYHRMYLTTYFSKPVYGANYGLFGFFSASHL